MAFTGLFNMNDPSSYPAPSASAKAKWAGTGPAFQVQWRDQVTGEQGYIQTGWHGAGRMWYGSLDKALWACAQHLKDNPNLRFRVEIVR